MKRKLTCLRHTESVGFLFLTELVKSIFTNRMLIGITLVVIKLDIPTHRNDCINAWMCLLVCYTENITNYKHRLQIVQLKSQTDLSQCFFH